MQTTAPPKACIIPVCNNLKFHLVHKFPADSERFGEWIQAITKDNPIPKLKGLTQDAIRKRFFVCARHFGLKEYKNSESRCLNTTSIPNLNLTDLQELTLSKAWVLDNSISLSDSPEEPVKASPLSPPTVRILNTGLSSNPLVSQVVKRQSVAAKVDVPESTEPVFVLEDLEFTVIEPAAKKTKLNVSPRGKPVTIEKVALRRSPNKAKAATKESPRTRMLVKEKEQTAEIKPDDKVDVAKATNKLLALIEVTPEQYERLNNSLSNAERNENVESLINFIDKQNDDPVAADSEIELVLPSGDIIFLDQFWLRDHCRCAKCYDHSTFQRKISVLDIPDDIGTESYSVQDEKLLVIWNDKHESSYNLDFLKKNQPSEVAIHKDRFLWNKTNIQSPLNVQCKVSMRDYMSDPDVSKKVLENLQSYGVAFIDGVQPKQENTEFVIRQLFPIQKTLFGEMWTFSDAKKDHSDTAYTNIYLGPHNDNTYFNDAAGLQILHCIQFDGSGGENFLIDGFQVAEKLKEENPEVFDRLTKTLVTAEYLEEGRHHKHTAPIIQLDPITGALEQIRFNLYDRAPFKSVPREKIRQFYSDLKVLTREFENPENRFILKLQPGTVMIFDNWRVLHGRLSYTGKRTMTGCYVARTEFQSALRVNQLID